MNERLLQFANSQYLNLETYRKNGTAVRTPMWFVIDDDVLYIRTLINSGKIKRVRNDSHVRIVPCGILGKPKGEWIDGEVRMATSEELKRVIHLFNIKYNIQKWLLDAFSKITGRKYMILVILV